MIQQRPGDLLEVALDEQFYYLVVLTKIVLFGGNVVFAFHGDGSRRDLLALGPMSSGFNICTDLLWPKKSGSVRRLTRLDDFSGFWRTRLVKNTVEYRRGHKAKIWFISDIDDLQTGIRKTPIEQRGTMPPEFASAMDGGMYSFDLVVEKMRAGYTPEQNPFL